MAEQLYLVHCGFYDPSITGGAFEGHTNLFVVGRDFAEARENAKNLPEFRRRLMHVDGIQRVDIVQGRRIRLAPNDPELEGRTELLMHRKRGHPPKLLKS